MTTWMPLLYTKRLPTPVYSRGGARPRPGTVPIPPFFSHDRSRSACSAFQTLGERKATKGNAMSKILRADAYPCDIEVERQRTDAIQAFLKQETIFVEIETDNGERGTGYSYTIGTGGRAGLNLLPQDLLPLPLGEDAFPI